MSNIVQSYDASNNAVYPVTHLRAVRDSSGTTLESMMQDVREMAVGYYECSTSGSTAAKAITIDSSVSLSTKILCKVKFVEKNKANNATMNINGTGAKALYYNGVRVAANNSWYPNEVVDLYYDGTNYQTKSCADTLEYNVSLHQTHEITEITTTTRTLVFNGDVVSTWESETPVSDSSVEGYTRSETNTGQDVDSTTIDGPNATYNSTTNKTNVVYVTTHTYTHVVNNYTFQEAVNAVPMSYRHGGLKLSFITNSNSSVQSSDNKYVQYRLISDTFTTTASEWQKQGAEVTVSQNTNTGHTDIEVGSKTDSVANADETDAIYSAIDTAKSIISTPNTGAILADGTISAASTNYKYSDFVQVSAGDKIIVAGVLGYNSMLVVSFYTTNDQEAVDTANSILGNGTLGNYIVTIPSGINYIRVCNRYSDNSKTTFICLKKLTVLENKDDIVDLKEDVKFLEIQDVDFSDYAKTQGSLSIYSNLKVIWNIDAYNRYHKAIPVPLGAQRILVTANPNLDTRFVYAKSYTVPTVSGTDVDVALCNKATINTLSAGNSALYSIPPEATYIIVEVNSNSADETPTFLQFQIKDNAGKDVSVYQMPLLYPYYILVSNNSLNSHPYYKLTDFIKLQPNATVRVFGSVSAGAYKIAVYSSMSDSDIIPYLSIKGSGKIDETFFTNNTDNMLYVRGCSHLGDEPNSTVFVDNYGIKDSLYKKQIIDKQIKITLPNAGYIPYDSTTPVSHPHYHYSDFIEVNAGDILQFKTAVSSGALALSGYTDKDLTTRVTDKFVNLSTYYSTGSNVFKNYIGVIPSNVKYVVFCSDDRVDTRDSIDVTINKMNSLVQLIKSNYKGKKISFLGDSITAYSGLVPEGHGSSYPMFDVTNPTDMWWSYLMSSFGLELGCLEGWAGSGVSGTDDGIKAISESRLQNLGSNGTPDIILLQIGTNDVNADFGEFAFWQTAKGNSYDKTKFRQAYAFIVERCMELYPNARIIAMSPIFRSPNAWWNDDSAPEGYYNPYGFSMQDMCDSIERICKEYHIPFIDMSRCGINYYNADTYLGDNRQDFQTYKVHPTAQGMRIMGEYVVKQFLSLNIINA